MIKIWFVVYILGNAAMVVGPTPDEQTCEKFRTEHSERIDIKFKAWNDVMPHKIDGDDREIHRKDVSLLCIKSAERPELGSTLQ